MGTETDQTPDLTDLERRALDTTLARRSMPHQPRGAFLARYLRLLQVLVAGAAALLIVAIAWSSPRSSSTWIPLVGTIVGVAVIACVACTLLHRRRRSRVLECHGLLCPWCHYAITDPAEESICPECGTIYELRAVVRMWQVAYRIPI